MKMCNFFFHLCYWLPLMLVSERRAFFFCWFLIVLLLLLPRIFCCSSSCNFSYYNFIFGRQQYFGYEKYTGICLRPPVCVCANIR